MEKPAIEQNVLVKMDCAVITISADKIRWQCHVVSLIKSSSSSSSNKQALKNALIHNVEISTLFSGEIMLWYKVHTRMSSSSALSSTDTLPHFFSQQKADSPFMLRVFSL